MTLQDDSRKARRDGRALAIAAMLRAGWTGRAVSAGLKVIDAGGGVVLAIEAMRAAQGADPPEAGRTAPQIESGE